MFQEKIIQTIQQSIRVKNEICQDQLLIGKISQAAEACIETFQRGGKVLFCGNGGSAADAQHLAAEFSGRFYKDRPPLFSEALHVNTSYLTAVGNDYGFDQVYSRIIKGIGKSGDILVGLSTSGNSLNILNAFKAAHDRGMTCIGFTGATGGKMAALTDLLINVPSTDTPRIQESHITIGHILCELVEKSLFP